MSETESDEMDYGVGSDDSDFQKEDFIADEEESDSSSRKRPASPKKETAPSSKRAKVASETKKSAPKKAKAEKATKKKDVSDTAAAKTLLAYINEQNKPFNANTIFENLHKEIKKAQVVRVLSDLAQDGKIIEKEYGKSKVYFANQDQFPEVDESELKQMDEEIGSLEEEATELKTALASLRSQMQELNSSMSEEELEKGIAKFSEENKQLEEKLAVLQGGETIDPKEVERLRQEVAKFQKLWRQRRSQCKEMINNVADGLEKKPSEVCEMIGIETEEELGIELPFKK